MRLRHVLGAIALGGGVVVASMACGPGELHKLMEGYPAEPDPNPNENPGDPCKHAYPPGQPATGTATAPDLPGQLVFAATDMRLDTGTKPASGLAPPVAYDLDHTCSCQPDAAPSCTKKTTSSTCDDDEHGADNAIGKLMNLVIATIPGIGPDQLKSRIDKGFFTLLVSVSAWNGTPNDDQVGVAVFMSPGLVGRNGDDPTTVPKRDGSDVWYVEPGSVANGDNHIGAPCDGTAPLDCLPIATDLKGYVTKGKLVASFEHVPFAFGDGDARITIPYSSAMLVGTLTGTDPGSYAFEGDLAGRWASHDILDAIARFSFTDSDGGTIALCNRDATTYLGVYTGICGATDLAPTRGEDGKKEPCTSLSESVHFKAQPAHLGTVQKALSQVSTDVCERSGLPTECPK